MCVCVCGGVGVYVTVCGRGCDCMGEEGNLDCCRSVCVCP